VRCAQVRSKRKNLIHTILQAVLLINEQVGQAPEDTPSASYQVRNQKVLGERPEAVKLCLEDGRDEVFLKRVASLKQASKRKTSLARRFMSGQP
jgi:hypothetical protein